MYFLYPFSPVDLVAMVLILVGLLQGIRRGLSGELAHILGTVAAIIAVPLSHRPIASWLLENAGLEPRAAGAIALFFAVITGIVVLVILRGVLKRVLGVVIEKEADRFAGAFAGAARAAVLVAVLFLLLNLVPHPPTNRLFGEDSVAGRAVLRIMPALREKLEKKSPALFEDEPVMPQAPPTRREDPV